jgi:hypothetical protein
LKIDENDEDDEEDEETKSVDSVTSMGGEEFYFFIFIFTHLILLKIIEVKKKLLLRKSQRI